MNRGLVLFFACFTLSTVVLYWLSGGILGEKEAPPLVIQESSDEEETPFLETKIGQQALLFYEQHQIQKGHYYHYNESGIKTAEISFESIHAYQPQEANLSFPLAKYYYHIPENKKNDLALPSMLTIAGKYGILRFDKDSQKIDSLSLESGFETIRETRLLNLSNLGLTEAIFSPVTIEGMESEIPNAIRLTQLITPKLFFSFRNRTIENHCFNQIHHYNTQGKLLLLLEGTGLQGNANLDEVTLLKNVQLQFSSQLWQKRKQNFPVEYWTSHSKGATFVQYDREKKLIYLRQNDQVVLTGNQSELQCQELEIWLSQNQQAEWQLQKLNAKGNVIFCDGKPIVKNRIEAGSCQLENLPNGEMMITFHHRPKLSIHDILGFSLLPTEGQEKLIREHNKYRFEKIESSCEQTLTWHRIPQSESFQEKFNWIGNVHIKQISRKIPLLELDAEWVEFLVEETREVKSQEQTTTRTPRWLYANKEVIVRHERGTAKGDFLQWQQFNTKYLWKELLSNLKVIPYTQNLPSKRRLNDLQLQYNPIQKFVQEDSVSQALFLELAFQKKLETCHWLALHGTPEIWIEDVEVGNSHWQGDFLPSGLGEGNQTRKTPNPSKNVENLYIRSQEPLFVFSYKEKLGRSDIYYGRKNVEIVRHNQQQKKEIGRISCQLLVIDIQHTKQKSQSKKSETASTKSSRKPTLQRLFAKGNVEFTGPEGKGGGETLKLRTTAQKQEIFELSGNSWAKNEQGSLVGNHFYYNKTTQKFIANGNPVQMFGTNLCAEGKRFTYQQVNEVLEIEGNRAKILQWEEKQPPYSQKPTLKKIQDIPFSKQQNQIIAKNIRYWKNSGKVHAKGNVELLLSSQSKGKQDLAIWASEIQQTNNDKEMKKYRLIGDEVTAEFNLEEKKLNSATAKGKNLQLVKIFPNDGVVEKLHGNHLVYCDEYIQWGGNPAVIYYENNEITSPQFTWYTYQKKVIASRPCQATLVQSQYSSKKGTPRPVHNVLEENKQPIHIQTKGNMIFWQAENQIELQENVQVQTDSAQLKCERLRIFLREQNIERILADGNVLLSSEGNTAHSQQLRWDQTQDVATLIGSPQVILTTKDFTLKTPLAWYNIRQKRFLTRGPNTILETQPKK